MKIRCRVFAGLALVFAMSAFTSAQQTPAIDEQALKKEVNAFMDQYWQLWSSGEIDQLVARVYHPFGQLSNQGHSTIEELKSQFPQTRKTLLAGGYSRSQMPMAGRNVCILAPNVAVVSGRGVRYLANGNVMGEYGWTYTLIKNATGWRMVSIYSHDPRKALTCSS
jgi:hypothetical protein